MRIEGKVYVNYRIQTAQTTGNIAKWGDDGADNECYGPIDKHYADPEPFPRLGGEGWGCKSS